MIAATRVREPLDRLLELAGALAGALGRVDAKAVVAEPGGGAEHRLVDAQVEPARGDRPPAAQLVRELGAAELQHLDRLLAGVEATRHSDPAAVVEHCR